MAYYGNPEYYDDFQRAYKNALAPHPNINNLTPDNWETIAYMMYLRGRDYEERKGYEHVGRI